MRVKVVIYPDERLREVIVEGKESIRVSDILRRVGLDEFGVIVRLRGKVVMEDEVVMDGDVVEIYEVMSGGKV